MTTIIANKVSCKRGGFQLFEPISFSLDAGQSLSFTGPNGIGKTTLLESIAGLRYLQKGSLSYHNKTIDTQKDVWFDNTFFIGHKTGNKKELNCIENLMSFMSIQGIKILLNQAQNALDAVGLGGYEYQMAGALSAGQKKRLALSRLLIIKHSIWILDEPFVNLDDNGCQWLLNLLKSHLKARGIVIITAHDNKDINNIVTNKITLKAQS